MTKLCVLKFGGTSQSLSGYDSCVKRISENMNDTYVICVSALSDITNLLLDYTKEPSEDIIGKVLKKHLKLLSELGIEDLSNLFSSIIFLMFNNYQDNLQGKIDLIKMGEKLSSMILYEYLQLNIIDDDMKVHMVQSEDLIKSNYENTSLYQLNNINFDFLKIKNLLKSRNIIITQGFMGGTPSGKTFLFGRGGSDTTGSILSHHLNADVYEIWTDVNGIYNIDPRLIKESKLLKNISYNLAQELSAMGAKVIHPYCIKPCQEKNIPIIIRNSFDYSNDYTTINGEEYKNIGLTLQKNNTLFKIRSINMWCHSGFVYEIFKVFKDLDINIDIISTSQFEISTTTIETDTKKIMEAEMLLKEKYMVEVITSLDLVSIVSNNILKINKIEEINTLLKDYPVHLQSHSSNDMSLSYLVNNNNSIEIIKKIYNLINI